MTYKQIVALLVSEAGRISNKYNISLLRAYNDLARLLYDYQSGQAGEGFMSCKEYYKQLTRFILGEGLPSAGLIMYLVKYYSYPSKPTGAALELDQAKLKELQDALREQQQAIRERERALRANEQSTREIRRIIHKQPATSVYELIEPIIKAFESSGQSRTITYIDLFNYGYMEGKRAERARRRAAEHKLKAE